MIPDRGRAAWLVLIAAIALAPAAAAQNGPPALHGPWLGIGLGGGIGSPSCSACVDNTTVAGLSLDLSGGWIVSDRVRVMLNVMGWRGYFRGITEHYGFALATVEVVPVPRVPLFVRAGIGVARSRTALKRKPDGGTDNVTTFGPGWEAALGHDIRVGETLVATATVSYYTTIPTELRFGGIGSGIDARHSLIRGGVTLRWFWSDPD